MKRIITLILIQEKLGMQIFFIKKTGTPLRPVIILNSSGEELFHEVWPMQGNDFKINDNNKITFYDLETDGWLVMDSLHNIVDSVYCLNG